MLLRNKIALVVVGTGIAVGSVYAIGTSDRVVGRIVKMVLGSAVRAPCRFESASFTFLEGVEVRGLEVLDPWDPFGAPLVTAQSCRLDYVLDVTGFGPHITRIEATKPAVRIERRDDGVIPLAQVWVPRPDGPTPPLPQVRLEFGSVTFADASIVAGPPLALTDLAVTLTPQPRAAGLDGAKVHVAATSDVLGRVELNATLGTDAHAVSLDLPRIRIDAAAVAHLAGDAGRIATGLSPSGELTAHAGARIEGDKLTSIDAVVELLDVGLTVTLPESHPGARDPQPIEVRHLAGKVSYADDAVELTGATFDALGARFEVTAKVGRITSAAPQLDAKARVRGLSLTRELRAHLPRAARRVAEAYDLTGEVDAVANARGDLADPVVTADATMSRGHVRYEGYEGPDGRRRGFPWNADDAAGTVSFDGRAIRIDATGRHGAATIRAKGVVDHPPEGGSIPEILITADDVPLDADIRTGFGERAPQVFDRWMPSGVARRIVVHVFRDPGIDGTSDITDVTIDCDGRAGFRPHLLPVEFSGAKGRIEVLNPVVGGERVETVRLSQLTARAEGFDIEISGEVAGDREDLVLAVTTPDASGGFRTAALAAPDTTLREGVKGAVRKLGASGPVRIDARLVQHAKERRDDVVRIALLGTAVTGWDDIPLAARNLTGLVTYAGDTLTFEDLAGEIVMEDFSPPFTGSGRLLDVSGDLQFDVHVESPDILLGEPLRAVLGPLAHQARAFWDDLRPQGNVHAALVLDLRPRDHPTPLELSLSGIHGALTPLGLELDNEDGSFHYDGRRAEIRGFESAIGAATVYIDEAIHDIATRRTEVRASVRGLKFPEDLEGPLDAATVAAIVEEAPGRMVHGSDLHIVYEPDPRAVSIAGDLSIRPRVRRAVPDPGYAPEGTLALERLVFWLPEDRPMYLQGEAQAESFAIRAGLSFDKLNGPIEFSGTLDGALGLDIRLRNASLRVEEYPLTKADARVRLGSNGVTVDGKAEFMGGDLAFAVGPGGPGVAYRGKVGVENASLERLLRLRADPDKPVATGRLDGVVEFSNATGASTDLRGKGRVTATEGTLMETPGIGAVVRFITVDIYTPRLTDARMDFDIEGEWILVNDVEVTGPGVNLSIASGHGRIGFDGRLDLYLDARIELPIPIIEQITQILFAPVPKGVHLVGTIKNPHVERARDRSGPTDVRREPQPAGEVLGPEREPW